MPNQSTVAYLTARELAARIKYKPNVINNMLKDSAGLQQAAVALCAQMKRATSMPPGQAGIQHR